MPTNFKRTFGNATSPLALSYLDDNFSQLEAAGTSTVSLSGAQLIGYMQSGSGAIARSVQAALRDTVSIMDFGGVCDGTTDDTSAWQAAINTGKRVICPFDSKLSSITISNTYQLVEHWGDTLTITGAGIVMNARGAHFRTSGRIVSDTGVAVVASALSPAPSLACAFDMRSNKMKVEFGKVEGFVDGILYADGNNAPDNRVFGNIELCNRAVGIKNTTGSAKHEGNQFDLTVFNCESGLDIAANCKYQMLFGVIDNVGITGSLDINDLAGACKFFPYFVRAEPDSVFGTTSILMFGNNLAYLKLYGSSSSSSLYLDGDGRIEIAGTNPFVDFKNLDSEDVDGRIQYDETLKDFKFASPNTSRAVYPFGSNTVKLYDDFLGDALDARWNAFVGSDPQCVTPTVVGDTGGRLRLTTGNDAAASMAVNGVQLDQGFMNWSVNQGSFYCEFRVRTAAITDICIFVGMTDQAAALEMPFTLGGGDALTANANNAFGVLFDTAADTDEWCLVGVKATVAATKQFTGSAPVADTYETWGIEVSTTGTATFYRNGTAVGTAMSNAVTASTPLTPVVATFTRSAASVNVSVDHVLVQASRPT